MAKPSKTVTTVARIAFLCSETVIDYRPAFSRALSFENEYKNLSRRNANGPHLVSVPNAADPGQYAKRYSKGDRLLSLTTLASSRTVAQLLPLLSEIASSPVVVHIAVNGDLSDVLVLRSSVPFLLHSATVQQAHDNALTASKLALLERRAVVHVFQADAQDDSIPDISDDKIQTFLTSQRIPLSTANVKTFLSNGDANGHTNGHANGNANGHTNGYTGCANGYSNGHGHGSGSNGTISRTPSEFSEPGSPSFHTHDDPDYLPFTRLMNPHRWPRWHWFDELYFRTRAVVPPTHTRLCSWSASRPLFMLMA